MMQSLEVQEGGGLVVIGEMGVEGEVWLEGRSEVVVEVGGACVVGVGQNAWAQMLVSFFLLFT